MTLTLGSGPFGPATTGRFNFERVGPRHVLYWEDWPRRMRAELGGATVLDSRGGKLLHETGHLPVHYFPEDDVRRDLLEPSSHTTTCPFKGEAAYWTARIGGTVAENVGWSYPDPIEGAPPLAGYLAFYWERLDRWYEEDEEVYGRSRDPYHRVDVRAGSYHVAVRHGDTLVAESDRPKLLFETGVPVRWYLPTEDVRTDLLVRSDTVSDCQYKGRGEHWHLDVAGTKVEDVAWSLPDPLPEGARAARHFCFYGDKVDVEVDGEPVAA